MQKNLKSLLAGICFAATSILATNALAADISGNVRSINPRSANFVVNTNNRRVVNVAVTPRTRIQADYRNDRRGPGYGDRNHKNQNLRFSDIRPGNYVHVRGQQRGREFIADSIEVRR